MHTKILRTLIITLIFLFGLQSCSTAGKLATTPTPYGSHPIESVFRDLYDKLGGETVLGQAISTLFTNDGVSCQYTENVLMCHNPQAKVESERLKLVPIGTLLVQPEKQEFKVYDAFQATYTSLHGALYVGRPLTGARVNYERRRMEQYFEKMGFYQLLDDPRGTVSLMAYGVSVCREHCSYKTFPSSAIIGWNKGVEVPTATSILRIGGFNTFGAPLTYPYTAKDGSQEQVFETILVTRPADNPSTLALKPLAKILGMPSSAPGPQVYGQKDNMMFYQIKNGLGYHVPIPFDKFVNSHGGIEISGKPISDPNGVSVNGISMARQCFENYCLEYDPSAAEDNRVHLMPLGETYRKQSVKEDYWVFEFSSRTTLLKVGETKRQVSSSEEQTIQVNVFQVNGMLPVSDIESILILGKPDGQKLSLNVPPTSLDGMATVNVPPLKNAPNGSLIPYVVCLNVPATVQICQSDSYLIWNIR